MATITSENAKQIRDPMKVHITFEAGEKSSISSYAPSTYKSYDSTLGDTSMAMRAITDLQDGGFPLDGTCEWYEEKSPNGENGKLGLRSIAGQTVLVSIGATSNISNITIKSSGVATIEKDGATYPATGLDVIAIGARTATLTFSPNDVNGRVFIDYIIPGAVFNITNDNLISCFMNLRSNLSADNPSWEESDIEVQFYYPYDVTDVLAYIQDDWPLTYQAGYSDEMSELRKFYLSEPGRQEGNVVTLHGVDASSLMDEKTISESFIVNNGTWNNIAALSGRTTVLETFKVLLGWFNSAGLTLAKKTATNTIEDNISDLCYAIMPEKDLRDIMAGIMNLTATLPEAKRFSFVDAGIPTLQVGEDLTRVWTLDESDLAEIVIETPRHANRVINTSEDRKFDELVKHPGVLSDKDINETVLEVQKGQLFEHTFATYVVDCQAYAWNGKAYVDQEIIKTTPSVGVWKASLTTKKMYVLEVPAILSGGVKQYSDSTGLPGVPIEMEPFIVGRIVIDGVSLFSPKNLLNRPNQTIQFKFKGDPRMQPRDFLQINRLDGTTYRTRIGTIEMSHEGGGTMATITAMKTNLWKEW